jgi:hypothetical protein
VILDSTIPSNPSAPLVATERVLWVGPLTVLTSVLAVQAVRLLVIQLPGVHTESVALGWVASTADTVILCTLAVLVLAGIGAFDDNPLRKFQQVAFAALLVSFLPAVIFSHGGPTAIALIAMHVAAYIPCATLMPRLAILRQEAIS